MSLLATIQNYTTPKEWAWIESKTQNCTNKSLQTAFVATPRFISKNTIDNQAIIEGLSVNQWTLDRLVRVYFLSLLDASDKDAYCQSIDALFETAENNEAVALVSALSILKFPDYWLLRATDAVRSNIGLIFDAIAFQNPYPMQYFSEAAWNQLILKCLFNDKPLHKILGLKERANETLTKNISDLAHERWAAGRHLPAEAWCVTPQFLNQSLLPDLDRLLISNIPLERIAGALACYESNFEAAHELLANQQELKQKVEAGELSWALVYQSENKTGLMNYENEL